MMINKVSNTRFGKQAYKTRNIYDSLYVALTYVAEKPHSVARSGFSTSKSVQNLAIKNELIYIVAEDEPTMSGKKDPRYEYYKITPKGLRYIQLYENLNQVISY